MTQMAQVELSNVVFAIANLLRGRYCPPQYHCVMLPMPEPEDTCVSHE